MIPVYTILMGSGALVALIGARAYTDAAPQDVVKPYVVWSAMGGTTNPFLGDIPGIDNPVIMFDVYSTTAAQREAIYQAMIAVLDPVAMMLAEPMTGWDFETKLFRMTFDYSFWQTR